MEADKNLVQSSTQQRGVLTVDTTIQWISIDLFHDYDGHPYQVNEDAKLLELAKSISEEGVLVPILARPRKAGEGYEIVSGHRRRAAAVLAGLDELPAIVREMDDHTAAIVMADSNLHREKLLPSEKAYAYALRYAAMKQQGRRTDLTSGQLDQKLKERLPENSRQRLAAEFGESEKQIQRYIRLINLNWKLLNLVDQEKIAFTVAVELSYLNEAEQEALYEVIEAEQSTPSLSQATRLKCLSQQGKLTDEELLEVMRRVKPNQREQIRIRADTLAPYFPKDFTPQQKIELIEKLVKNWYQSQQTQ